MNTAEGFGGFHRGVLFTRWVDEAVPCLEPYRFIGWSPQEFFLLKGRSYHNP